MANPFNIWIKNQARQDLKSAKLLLDQTSDLSNTIFLLEQSYEKIVKLVYVHCETYIFKRDFQEVYQEIFGHEQGVFLTIKMLNALYETYENCVRGLYERVADAVYSDRVGLDKMAFFVGALSTLPKLDMITRNERQFASISNNIALRLPRKGRRVPEKVLYDYWKELVDVLRRDMPPKDSFVAEFDRAYEPYMNKISKVFDNADEINSRVKNFVLFLAFAIGLAPLTLAYKYARYPHHVAKYVNLKELAAHEASTKKGLTELYYMVKSLVDSCDDVMEGISIFKNADFSIRRWKKRQERLIRKRASRK